MLKFSTKGVRVQFIVVLVCLFHTNFSFADRYFDERPSRTAERLNKIYHALSSFKKACGRYPLTKEGIESIERPPEKLKCKKYTPLADDSVESNLEDGWYHRFDYESDGMTYRITGTNDFFLTEKTPVRKHSLHWNGPDSVMFFQDLPPDTRPVPKEFQKSK